MNTNLVNKKVIARINRAGVYHGVLDAWGDIIRLKDVRRIYYWQGALSVTDMSVHGIKGGKVTCPASEVEFLAEEVIEVNACSDEASKAIESVPAWKA